MEFALVRDGEIEEDPEPQTKRLKQGNRTIRFRAIKPKPPGSVQLLKCQSCNFITTEQDLLSCHRLVCSAMAYKCTMCDKKFDSQKMIRNHKIEAHLTKWICHFCNISFNEEKKFTVHMKNHLGDRLNSKTIKTKVEECKKEKAVLTFKCPHCAESFEAFSQLQIHLVNHTSSVTFKCVRCDIGFQNKLELINHISDLQEGQGKTFVCAECSFSTSTLAALKQHFVSAHEAFKCWICKKNFQMDELKKHLATEHGANAVTLQSKSYTCVHCSEKFTNRRALHLHEIKHPENLNIQCPDCGEKFARDKFLNEHREVAHTVSHCRVCNKAFGNVKQLKSHEARHAKSDKTQFKCTDCDRIFQTPTGLRHHKAIHTGEFKYKCEFCGKGFVARVRYEEHRASHTKEERYSCEICGKKFSFQATYWIHRKWHDNPTPYKCEYCGRLFKHSSLLSVHKRKHTGERPYECPHCDQSFTVGNTLKRHLMLHTGVFPFTCQICDQGFSGKHKMALHMSKVHNDNSLLGQQTQKKPTEYKMVVKDTKKSEVDATLQNQTWVLKENDNSGSQMLTIQTEEGENIPCTLLTDDMIGNIVNTNNRIVEIIPYDSIKGEDDVDDEGNEVGFILMNQTDESALGIVNNNEDEDFKDSSTHGYNGECTKVDIDSVEGMDSGNSQSQPCDSFVKVEHVDVKEGSMESVENMSEEFVSVL
ncbi:zinc finger protein, putative [Pediculus humanus corporis]|uniref:Zinc finger protein, putative n=1 Tax=Pediculus humanus subsp. corporis TaxID=121224 RepID=E0VXI9_PEDHC|nr:zinc finger protein, putative [Pediculus humanus corporis]EEB18095.1 zinc finger protein, putative [Pediculus humanus corporis]